MKQKTWKILEWVDEPDVKAGPIPLQCSQCDRESYCPTGVLSGGVIIAISGMSIITDPPGLAVPDSFLPTTIECRGCGMIYGDKNSSYQDNQCTGKSSPEHSSTR